MKLTFEELLMYCQAEALAAKVNPDEESIYRSICRGYSKKFNTPLHVVMEMDPEHVIRTHYEDQLDEVDLKDNIEEITDVIFGLADPDYEKKKEAELDEFAAQAEREEEERIKSGRPIHKSLAIQPSLKNSLSEQKPILPENAPTEGHIDLSYLEKEEAGE